MLQDQLRPTARHDFTATEIDALEDRIYDYNVGRTGLRDAAQLGFAVMAEGELIAAIAGFTWGGICELRQLFVDERFRGQGHGTALLKAAIDEARDRGCKSIHLATYSFQAPGFYDRFGFERISVIPERPLGHLDILMRLDLAKER